MITLVSAVRSLRALLDRITTGPATKFPFYLVVVTLLCALPSQGVAQSNSEHCATLGQQIVDTLNKAQADDSFDDIQFLGNDKESKMGSEVFEQWFQQWKNDWKDVIAAGRRYLGECPQGPMKTTDVLVSIAHGLRHQGQQEDEIPILNKCITIDPDESLCWFELGRAETGLCQFNDAEEAFRKVVAIGGFTTRSAQPTAR